MRIANAGRAPIFTIQTIKGNIKQHEALEAFIEFIDLLILTPRAYFPAFSPAFLIEACQASQSYTSHRCNRESPEV